MAAPTADDLAALLGDEFDVPTDQAEAVLGIVTAMAKSYTRDQGFTDDVPNSDLRAIILVSAARLLVHPRQISMSETLGPQTASFGQGFTGWTIGELFVLNRYRDRAQ